MGVDFLLWDRVREVALELLLECVVAESPRASQEGMEESWKNGGGATISDVALLSDDRNSDLLTTSNDASNIDERLFLANPAGTDAECAILALLSLISL